MQSNYLIFSRDRRTPEGPLVFQREVGADKGLAEASDTAIDLAYDLGKIIVLIQGGKTLSAYEVTEVDPPEVEPLEEPLRLTDTHGYV